MKKSTLITVIVLISTMLSCNQIQEQAEEPQDEIKLSFAFIGCNRISYTDRKESNDSKANVPALQRIFKELAAMERKPELLFFLGDLVLGEQDTTNLEVQLAAWVEQYKDPSFSDISTSGIELVAVTGNHEMLFYDVATKGEYPLEGATEDWLKNMGDYMPADRSKVPYDTLINGATFSFVRDSIGFVVMNADTYNAPANGQEFGEEGRVPYQWVNGEIERLNQDANVKHLFAVGHRPYYVDGKYDTLHGGFPDGPKVWPTMMVNNVAALITAHQHKYQRWQPEGQGIYEIIAGQGGTYSGPDTPKFYGYSLINVYESGRIELITKGWDLPNPTWGAAPQNPTTTRDSTTLTPAPNANPYDNGTTGT
jgi:hypothetical protein